jgi:hypothetical protein
MHTLSKPIAVVALTASALLVSAGGAYAYWTASGTGTGTVTVASIKPLLIEQVDVKDLALGSPAELHAKVSNPNDFEASLLGTQITVRVIVDVSHRTCDAANFAIAAPSTKAELIKANSSIDLDKGSITLLNTTAQQAACQGATVTLAYQLKQKPSTPPPSASVKLPQVVPQTTGTSCPSPTPKASAKQQTQPGPADPTAVATASPTSDPTASQTP